MSSRLSFVAILCFIIYGCSSTSKIEKHYTPDDKTVFDLIDRLKKNPSDAEASRFLPNAYDQAAEVRKNINISNYNNLNPGDRWVEISRQLMVCQQMYDGIKSVPAASKAVPHPWNPSLKIQEAKRKAADEYYHQGMEYMSYNNRPYAQKAYEMFSKADEAYPNYPDVRNQMARALEISTIKVLVRPVNYYSYGWNYWGFQNDYLQFKIVNDLNNSSFRDVRFYTDADIRFQHLPADKVVELRFNDLNIGQVFNDQYQIKRSKQIQTGETKAVPSAPVYQTVYATVFVTRSIMQSRASLECRISDWVTNGNILFDHFPDNFTWKHESARYTGDQRALEPSDWTLINNAGNSRPPSQNEIAQRLIDNCYYLLLNRIRTGVKF